MVDSPKQRIHGELAGNPEVLNYEKANRADFRRFPTNRRGTCQDLFSTWAVFRRLPFSGLDAY